MEGQAIITLRGQAQNNCSKLVLYVVEIFLTNIYFFPFDQNLHKNLIDCYPLNYSGICYETFCRRNCCLAVIG
jgi:hypothetical protein